MSTLDSMKSKLKPLCLYDLSDSSLISAELKAYAEGLDILYDVSEEIEKECFISTAENYGLDLRERLYSSTRSNLTLSERREMLLYRYSITSNDFNKESIEKALVAAGIRGYIIEAPSANKIYINCLELFDTMVSNSMAQAEAEKFLPAHLSYDFDFRPLQWVQIEDKDMTFSQMDAADLTWDQIDNYDE
ncbi:MAG: hypothetical protein RUMPE_00880 [Eubacteriales bacterium SKADARSKE-1]|nr:hypothetical protein [Eubacteriales bacterium SKADARSKE-1]